MITSMKFSAILVHPLTLISLICGALTYIGSFIAWASNADYSYLPASEVKQLQVENQSVPALLRPWIGNKQLGLAIIVPALGEHADAPGLPGYLRRELNEAGWATLALTPPSLLASKPPIGLTDSEPEPEPAQQNVSANSKQLNRSAQSTAAASTTSIALSAQQTLVQQQQDFMLASMAQLDALGKHFAGKRMLIVMGDSANLIIELLASKRLPMPDLMVIVNPYSELESANKALPEKLAALAIPVLDIQSKDGTAASIATQVQRRSSAPANAPTRYSQQVLALDLTLEVAWDNSLELIEGFVSRINKAYPNG
ncbi:conserved hypothetical protein [Shewanella pealeana ATCC 700345]|uniref:DUF3530 domain-containing protein n=2 Tax=Shewanella pealeana TaxID=70864 RepID=A8H8X9_SHEPA|nr:conserved hypothetical protein [Shewanella pealeana ATCC 700345]